MNIFKRLAVLSIATFVCVFLIYKVNLITNVLFSKWWLNFLSISNKVSTHSKFTYIHFAKKCSDSVKIFVAVCSAPINKVRRDAIRETWGQHARNNTNFKMVFFEGITNSTHIQDDIDEESMKYGDIVQENYVDHYANLSLKSLAYLRWVNSSCRQTKFVLKTDDDMYINLPLLEQTVMNLNNSRFIMGSVFRHVHPIRHNKSKWFTPRSKYYRKEFPEYVSGTAYLLSGDIIPELYAESFHRSIFWLEDVYITGMLANRVKARRITSTMFTIHAKESNGCTYKHLISGHRVTPRAMKIIYKQLRNSNHSCH